MAKDTNKRMSAEIVPSLSFPVIRGTQAGREYFVAMWSLRTLRQISIFDDRELLLSSGHSASLIAPASPRSPATSWITPMTMSSRL